MCGRFVLYSSKERIADRFGVDPSSLNIITHWEARYNIAPSTHCLIVRPSDLGWREMVSVSWGLLPHWAKSAADRRYINARGETIFEKPAFRATARHKRCLVVADGYYEWKAAGGRKVPYFFSMTDEQPFAMAGMWDSGNASSTGLNRSPSLRPRLTNYPRQSMIGCPASSSRRITICGWTARTPIPRGSRRSLRLTPHSMQCWAVSTKVGDPKNETPDLIKPAK